MCPLNGGAGIAGCLAQPHPTSVELIPDNLQDELRAYSVLAPAGDAALLLTPRNGQGQSSEDSAEGIALAEGVEGHILRTIALICGPSKPRKPAEAVSWMLGGLMVLMSVIGLCDFSEPFVHDRFCHLALLRHMWKEFVAGSHPLPAWKEGWPPKRGGQASDWLVHR